MTRIADIEVSRGNAKLVCGVLLFLGILLFLNYGVAAHHEGEVTW
jgi:hypothetical protein